MALLPPTSVLPRSGPQREALREKGQFWTPDWVADAMVAYALGGGATTLFDPAVGGGAFLRAARRSKRGTRLNLAGRDVDPAALAQALESGLAPDDLANVELRDFVLSPPQERFEAIVANPPYVRHHRLDGETKTRLRHFARQLIGRDIDGRAGLHVYFLLRCLERLSPGGRLAFIVSADICEGVFAPTLWAWVCRSFCLDAVVAFSAEATPFPGVDTNALLFLIRNAPPAAEFAWALVSQPETNDLRAWIEPGFVQPQRDSAFVVTRRQVAEGLAAGFSRPLNLLPATTHCLGDFARVMRGIVTGDNEFFFLTRAQAEELAIPPHFLLPAIGRTRDVTSERLTRDDLLRLETAGRPTWLLSINGTPRDKLPVAIERYLQVGEQRGLPAKTLIALRNPWFKMETRSVPPILFAYLGRRNARFIRNEAGVVPLTCLLCVYPFDESPAGIERFWRVVSDARTVANLKLVGKSYGGGAIKVEPRALERLPLPEDLVKEAGLAAKLDRVDTNLELAF